MPMRRAWQLRCCQHTNNVTKRIAARELADSEMPTTIVLQCKVQRPSVKQSKGGKPAALSDLYFDIVRALIPYFR